METNHIPDIKDFKFSWDRTIVFWSDGTKTIIKCADTEDFDPEKGLALAFMKRALNNDQHFFSTLLTHAQDAWEMTEDKRDRDLEDIESEELSVQASMKKHSNTKAKIVTTPFGFGFMASDDEDMMNDMTSFMDQLYERIKASQCDIDDDDDDYPYEF